MSPADTIKSYLSGQTSLQELYEITTSNPEMEKFLEQDVVVAPYTNSGTLFTYLIGIDPSDPLITINAKDALSRMLTELNIEHHVDSSEQKSFELLLDASPTWAYLPNDYLDKLQDEVASVRGKQEKLKRAKARIAADFKYLKKPPRWIQSPAWPFSGNKPLVFVGQLDLADLMHDTGQVYVFYDQEESSYRTIAQVA